MLDVKTGEEEILLKKDMVRFPPNLSLVNIDPNKIPLKVIKMVTLKVPVKLDTRGNPPAGIIIQQMVVEPREVSVVIPSTLNAVKLNISTEPVDLQKITGNTVVAAKLVIPPDVRLANDIYPEIKVSIEVAKK